MVLNQLKTQTKGLWHKARPVMQTGSLTRLRPVYGAWLCYLSPSAENTLAMTS